MLVLERVRSSTRLTMTAQARLGPPFSLGIAPGTTTEEAGTRPYITSPVARSTILVEAPRKTPIDSTAPCSTTTPSATSERAPMKQSSSMMTGPAWSGSSTPDRKSTRLNSSHLVISYAVFCLKKKTQDEHLAQTIKLILETDS